MRFWVMFMNIAIYCKQTSKFGFKQLIKMKTSKTLKTFEKIEALTHKMWLASLAAQCDMSEKKRDKVMDKIIKLNEKIEELYSCNWH